MKIFGSLMIIMASVFLWMLPLSQAVYDFRTDLKEETQIVTTVAGVTSANVTLSQFIYGDDTSTFTATSTINEVPTLTSYNSTSKTVLVGSLTANTSRTLTVTYDVNVITGNTALESVLDIVPFFYYLFLVLFPAAGIASIFNVTSRMREWLHEM